MVNGQRLRNFALGDQEKIKMNSLFQKTIFLQKSSHFLQNLKIDGIFTLYAIQIVGTVEGKQ